MAIVPLPSTPRARVPLPLSRERRRRYSPIVSSPFSPRSLARFLTTRPDPSSSSRHGAAVGRSRGDADVIPRRRRISARVVVARAVRTERRRRRRERTARRTATRDSHRASPAPSRSRVPRRPRASFPHPNVIHPPRARARGNDARDIHSTRRPSSIVRRRRDASREREEKNGRSSRTSLAELARSLVRSRARDDVARNDRARRRVSSKSAGPVASLHFFIRARGYRVEACVKSMYVCEWFDTVKKRKKRCRRPVYVQ